MNREVTIERQCWIISPLCQSNSLRISHNQTKYALRTTEMESDSEPEETHTPRKTAKEQKRKSEGVNKLPSNTTEHRPPKQKTSKLQTKKKNNIVVIKEGDP